MAFVEIKINHDADGISTADREILREVEACVATAEKMADEDRNMDAFERIVEGMRLLREFSDFDNIEFRAMLCILLGSLAEIHYRLKDYKQSEKELDTLFKILDTLVRRDPERFGSAHINAMELSTRILRSRKKAMDMLVKQQITAGALYDKVNSGVVAATDKLVEALRKVGVLLAASGDYQSALKFLSEAIKYSKKRSGRVTRKEVKMTIEMAEIMIRMRRMRPRALRLLNAIMPHAVALGTIELEEDILALIEIIDHDEEREPKWRTFLNRLTLASKARERREKKKKESEEKTEETE